MSYRYCSVSSKYILKKDFNSHLRGLENGDKDKDKVTRQKSESHEYFKAKVHVTPLKFSEKNYTKNEITEKLFAGSIHIGYTENETTLESPTENVNAQRFTSWRDLFDEKMKLEE